MTIALPFAIAMGAAVGSFIRLCADRWPAGKSILWPGSHCDACHARLGALDLVPVLSYLWLRGCCRHCGARIPAGVVVVELITAFVFGAIWLRVPGLDGSAAAVPMWSVVSAVNASLLILVAVIDLQVRLIPNNITYPWAVLALAASVFLPAPGLGSAIVGAAVGLAVFGAIYALSRGGMGFGDVKLAGVLGLILGFPTVLEAVALAWVSGGVVGAGLLLLGRKGRKDALPFGVFLAFGGVVTLLWGPPLWEAYVRLMPWG